MQFDLVQLLQLGFHGAALAFLIVGYRLMRQVLGQGDRGDLEVRLKAVRFFLGVSVTVLVVGVGAQILVDYLDSRYQVEVHLSPSAMPNGLDEPVLRTQEGPVTFDQGLGLLTVGRNLPIRLVMDKIFRRIEVLEAELREHQEQLASEEGGGFDEDAG